MAENTSTKDAYTYIENPNVLRFVVLVIVIVSWKILPLTELQNDEFASTNKIQA